MTALLFALTLACLALTTLALARLDRRFKRLDSAAAWGRVDVEAVGEEIGRLDARFAARIDALETVLAGRLANGDIRVDRVDNRIDALEAVLATRFDFLASEALTSAKRLDGHGAAIDDDGRSIRRLYARSDEAFAGVSKLGCESYGRDLAIAALSGQVRAIRHALTASAHELGVLAYDSPEGDPRDDDGPRPFPSAANQAERDAAPWPGSGPRS